MRSADENHLDHELIESGDHIIHLIKINLYLFIEIIVFNESLIN